MFADVCLCVVGNYKVAYNGHNTQLENEFDQVDSGLDVGCTMCHRAYGILPNTDSSFSPMR